MLTGHRLRARPITAPANQRLTGRSLWALLGGSRFRLGVKQHREQLVLAGNSLSVITAHRLRDLPHMPASNPNLNHRHAGRWCIAAHGQARRRPHSPASPYGIACRRPCAAHSAYRTAATDVVVCALPVSSCTPACEMMLAVPVARTVWWRASSLRRSGCAPRCSTKASHGVASSPNPSRAEPQFSWM